VGVAVMLVLALMRGAELGAAPPPVFAAPVDCRQPHDTHAGASCSAYWTSHAGNVHEIATLTADDPTPQPGDVVTLTITLLYPPAESVTFEFDPDDEQPHLVSGHTGMTFFELNFPGAELVAWGEHQHSSPRGAAHGRDAMG
jgi:hypothetical protein